MYIEKIRFKNFKSVGGKFTELDIGRDGLHLIKGANGTAKSTIFHAITFGLFGKNSHTRGASKTSIPASELVNDINKKEMVVELYLPGYIIKRGIKPDFFEIIDRKDGKNIADKSSKNIDQKYLEDNILNGLNYDIYTKIVFLNSKATSKPFLYMTNTERKDFVEYILDLRLVYFVKEVIKGKLSDVKLDMRDSENNLSTAQSLLKAEEYKLEEDKKKLQEQKEKLAKIEAQKQEMIDAIDKSIEEKHTKIKALVTDFDKLKAEEKLEAYRESLTTLRDKQDQVIDKRRTINKTIDKLNITRDTHLENLKGFELCGTCPTVKKIVGDFDEEQYKAQIKDYEEALEKLGKVDTKIEDKTAVLEDAIKALKEKLEAYKYNQREIKSLENSIADDEAKKKKLDRIEEMELFEIDHARELELKDNVNAREKQHDQNVNAKLQLERIKERVSDKSIKTEILEYYTPLLQNKINELLEVFFEDDDFSFNIEINESFEITGFKNGKKTNIFKLSEGQLSSLSLAFTLSFQYLLSLKNSIDFKLFTIDEILDIALDNNRLDKIIQYLKNISKDKAVLIISHNNSLNLEYFDRIIESKKVNKFSEYTIELKMKEN